MDYPKFPKTEPYDMDKAEDSTLIIDGFGEPVLREIYSPVIKIEAIPQVESSVIEDCSDEEYSSEHMDTEPEPEAVYLPKVKVEYSDDEEFQLLQRMHSKCHGIASAAISKQHLQLLGNLQRINYESKQVNVENEEATDEFLNTLTEEPLKDESCPTLQNLSQKQIYQHHNIQEGIKGWNILQSSNLGQLFKTQGPVKRIPGQVFKCDVCAKEFQHFCHLKKHTFIHLERKFKCEICFTRFAQSSNLKAHMLVHSGDRIFECPVCSKKFARSWNLKAHSVIHTGERKFSCSICPRQFALRHNLLKHQLVHTKEKKYTCSVCGSQYAHLSYLRTHLMAHAGQKKFYCSICNKGFLESHKLKLHSVVHTKEKNYPCSICEKKFTQSTSLKRHLSKIHKRSHTAPARGRRSIPNKQCLVSAAAQQACMSSKELYNSPSGQSGMPNLDHRKAASIKVNSNPRIVYNESTNSGQ